MRVNVYAEEMTDRVEIISKDIDGHTFTGLRLYLEMPASYHLNPENGTVVEAKPGDWQQARQLQAPFIHRPGDDDSSAVTFWGKRDLRTVLRKMLAMLDEYYAGRIIAPPSVVEAADTWRPWSGGACPVDPETLVLVHFREGTESENTRPAPASRWDWKHEGGRGDIVAFKICAPGE